VSTPEAAALGYPRTYRGSTVNRIFGFIATAILAAFVAVPLLAGVKAHLSPGFLLLLAMPLSMALYVLAATLRSRLVLTADAIEVYGAFAMQRLARGEIEGRRTIQVKNGTVTELIPSDLGEKSLRIPAQIVTDPVLKAWLASLPDLDAQDRAASEARIEANPEFGPTPEARRAWVEEAGRLAMLINIVAGAAFVWALFLHDPFRIGTLVLVILPGTAIFMTARSHGLYRLTFERNDVRPTLVLAVLLPGFALPMQVFQEIGVLDVPRLLTYAASVALLLGWAALRSAPPARAGSWLTAVAVVLIALCGYGLGLVALGNTYFDTAPGHDYRVAVLDKYESHGRSTSYHLTLAPWGPRTGPQRMQVSAALYRAVTRGGDVCVHQGPGALRASWYEVKACQD